MKIDGINARVTRFIGNLYSVTLPYDVSEDKQDKFDNVRRFLANISGGTINGFIDPLSVNELSRLPEGITFVLTNDTYTHLLPMYNENVRYALLCL